MTKIVHPNEVWVKTRFFTQGDHLCATVYLVANGNPEVMNFKINMAPIVKAIARHHISLHRDTISGASDPAYVISGIVSFAKNAAKKVSKAKLVQKVSSPIRTAVKKSAPVLKTAKKVTQSKITGGVLMATAVAFPPVGAPALAAYATANAALAAVDRANAVRNQANKVASQAKYALDKANKAKGLLSKVSNLTKSNPSFVKAVKNSPQAKKLIQQAVQQKKVAEQTVSKAMNISPKTMQEISRVVDTGKQAKAILADIAAKARYGENEEQKAEAVKTAQIISLVNQARDAQKGIALVSPQAVTGVLLDAYGNLVPGEFEETSNTTPIAQKQLLLAAQQKIIPGYFKQIAGW